MCDTYTANCENCGCEMNLHIADFCTPRENVIPYCHRCTRKVRRGKVIPPEHCQAFYDSATTITDGEIMGIKRGDEVVIYCKDENAYGIYLN